MNPYRLQDLGQGTVSLHGDLP